MRSTTIQRIKQTNKEITVLSKMVDTKSWMGCGVTFGITLGPMPENETSDPELMIGIDFPEKALLAIIEELKLRKKHLIAEFFKEYNEASDFVQILKREGH